MEPSATVNGSSAGSSVFPGAVGPMHAPSATADDQFAQTTAGRQVCSVTGLFPWFLPFFRPAGRPLLQYRNPEPSPLPWIPGKQRPGGRPFLQGRDSRMASPANSVLPRQTFPGPSAPPQASAPLGWKSVASFRSALRKLAAPRRPPAPCAPRCVAALFRSPAPAKAPPWLRAPFYQSQREHFRCKGMSSPESHTCQQEGQYVC